MNDLPRPALADDYSLLLKKIADELLSAQSDDNTLKAAAAELYSLCSSVTETDDFSGHANDNEGIRLPSGEAISPNDAARCILDYRRTAKFLKGLYAATLEAQKRFPDTAIEILYAGCGPFAPLAVPLTSRFNSSEIKFTLLDAHKRSLDAARHIFYSLGKSDFVRDYIKCDAASYRNNAPHVIHIVLVEAMQRALEKEPQVAITMNLSVQLCPRGIFLPERVAVACFLCDLTKEFPLSKHDADAADFLSSNDRVRINLGGVLDLTPDYCRHLLKSVSSDEYMRSSLPAKTFYVPKDLKREFHLMLSTSITVFDSIVLRDYESGLTCPQILYDAGKVEGGTIIEFEYQLGDNPGFRYRFL